MVAGWSELKLDKQIKSLLKILGSVNINICGSFIAFNSTLQTMEDPILIAEYDAEWPMLYEPEKIKILNVLANTIADIQHIGSTSVPGLVE